MCLLAVIKKIRSTMESIAAAASLLTILEAAVSVSKSATEFCRSIRETPDELAHLSRRTLQTHARLNIQFHLHQSLSNRDFGAFLPHDALKALEVDLDNARASLDQIKRSASIQVRQSSAHQRVVWVLHEKRKVKKISENLRDIDDNLSSMLTTWSM